MDLAKNYWYSERNRARIPLLAGQGISDAKIAG